LTLYVLSVSHERLIFFRSSSTNVPAHTKPQSSAVPTVAAQAPSGSGLFGQMAATAGGVAVGSAVVSAHLYVSNFYLIHPRLLL